MACRRPAGSTARARSALVSAGTAAWPLARDDGPLTEDLASPHAPRLLPIDRAGDARATDGAVGAQGLGVLDVSRRLGEEELRVEGPAGQQRTERVDLRGP